jgi:hypothetical protein
MLIMEKFDGSWQQIRTLRSDSPFPGTIHDRITDKNYVFQTSTDHSTISDCEPFDKRTVSGVPSRTALIFEGEMPELHELRQLRHNESHEMTLHTDFSDVPERFRFRHENEA